MGGGSIVPPLSVCLKAIRFNPIRSGPHRSLNVIHTFPIGVKSFKNNNLHLIINRFCGFIIKEPLFDGERPKGTESDDDQRNEPYDSGNAGLYEVLYGLSPDVHVHGHELHGDGQLRCAHDEDVDGLRSDVPDVRGLYDAQFRDVDEDVRDVRRNLQQLRNDVRIDGQRQSNDDGMRQHVPYVRRQVHGDGEGVDGSLVRATTSAGSTIPCRARGRISGPRARPPPRPADR